MLELDPPRKAEGESEDSESGDSESEDGESEDSNNDGLKGVEDQVQNLSVGEGTKSGTQDRYYHHD